MHKIFKSFRRDTIVFIDGANLFYAQKALKIKVDYQKLYSFLKQYKRLTEIRIYLAFDNTSKKDKDFIQLLKKTGYTVIQKKLKLIKHNNKVIVKKGNVDIELALDAYILRKQYRTIILFSGDSDFDVLLKRLQNKGRRTVVFSTRKHVSKELIQRSHKYIDLKSIKTHIRKNPV